MNKDDEMVKVLYQQAVGSLMYVMLCTLTQVSLKYATMYKISKCFVSHYD